MAEIRTFFIQLGKETKKVVADSDDLNRLPELLRSKFDSHPSVAKAGEESISFEMKDKEFGVVAKIDDFQDIYSGAVVTCKIKGASSSPSPSVLGQVESAKRKLASLEARVGQKRARPNGSADERFIVRMRGLPWHSNVEDIRTFFDNGVSIVPDGIVMVQKLGRPSGEAFVEVESQTDFDNAIAKDHKNIGNRYIEVYKATINEAERGGLGIRSDTPRSAIPVSDSSRVLRLRGLPYSATEVDVHTFLDGVMPVAVHFPTDHLGRPSGDCFVEVLDESDESKVLARSKHNMGERYVDVLKSDAVQLRNVMHVSDGPSSHSHAIITPDVQRCIRMRGLPWGTEEHDINGFFQAVGLIPQSIHRKADGSEAYVEFASLQESAKAMTRNKCFIGSRYIELFYVAYNEMAALVGLPPENQYGGPYGAGPYGAPMQGNGYDMGGSYGGYNQAGARGGGYMQQGGGARGGGGYPPQGHGGYPPQHGSDQYGGGSMYGGGGGGGGAGTSVVKMRGLPYSATKNDVIEFFKGHPILQETIQMGQNAQGRSDGQAYVGFPNTQAARAAVQQNDRQFIQNRYIELSVQ